jgi:hypothetical protein
VFGALTGALLALSACTDRPSTKSVRAQASEAPQEASLATPVPAAPSVQSAVAEPVPATPERAPTFQAAIDGSQIDQAMAQFVRALQERNVESLLQCFSRKKSFFLTGTSSTPHDKSRFSYAQLETGMKPGGDFVGILFGGEGDDNFRDYVKETGGRAWRSKPAGIFVPPIDHNLTVFVRWRREGNRWVVEEIAFPAG